jgi:hypothetical protein
MSSSVAPKNSTQQEFALRKVANAIRDQILADRSFTFEDLQIPRASFRPIPSADMGA